ncbi:MAG: diphthine--ammonia ligase [Sulfolobales archaeon]|nr:diphthine--ammonia ligase [Sulfolobales archaeon]MDW8082259.1 diphthine--ammonia ligase [Sulfolobales archaeon]
MWRAVALYSGGKDSHYSILTSQNHNIFVEALVVALPRREDSWLFHTVNVLWSKLHGEAMGIPVHLVPVSGFKDFEYLELRDSLHQLLTTHSDVDYLVAGAVKSKYQLEKFKALAEELGLKLYAPLWGRREEELLEREVGELSFIVTAIQAYCLSPRLLGNPSSSEIIYLLTKAHRECGVSLVGEGGEFETFVIRSPLFRGRGVAVRRGRMVLHPHMFTGYYIIEDADLF